MKSYYFTFGQNHWHRNGTPLKNFWVKVVAESYDKARGLFIERFASQYLEANDKWGFQYEEQDFEPKYFPQGEYAIIHQ